MAGPEFKGTARPHAVTSLELACSEQPLAVAPVLGRFQGRESASPRVPSVDSPGCPATAWTSVQLSLTPARWPQSSGPFRALLEL